jgi:hypothetical protein
MARTGEIVAVDVETMGLSPQRGHRVTGGMVEKQAAMLRGDE